MNKDFDDLGVGKQQREWHLRWLTEAFRILKPGGIIRAFCGTRTQHHLSMAMYQAGFVGFEEGEDIRVEAWVYGSGFPKSLSVPKAIDRELGSPRSVQGTGPSVDRIALDFGGGTGKAKNGLKSDYTLDDTPRTEEAKQWEGWGTALKPAWESICVGRKPWK